MLTSRNLISTKNLPAIMEKIVQGTAPDKFTVAHLRAIGFKSSNDQAIIPLLKDLKFLSDDGSPTQRYQDYRDTSRSRQIMAQALREAYEDLFHINAKPSDADRKAIEGRFKSAHNATDIVAQRQAATFLALLKLADLDAHSDKSPPAPHVEKKPDGSAAAKEKKDSPPPSFGGFRYNIEIHLPASKDVEVYNAIFKSLNEHLL